MLVALFPVKVNTAKKADRNKKQEKKLYFLFKKSVNSNKFINTRDEEKGHQQRLKSLVKCFEVKQILPDEKNDSKNIL